MNAMCNASQPSNRGFGAVLSPREGRLPTYFPGTIYVDEAQLIDLRAGTTVGNVDVALREVRLRRVRVEVVTGATGRQVRTASLTVVPYRAVFPSSQSLLPFAASTAVLDAATITFQNLNVNPNQTVIEDGMRYTTPTNFILPDIRRESPERPDWLTWQQGLRYYARRQWFFHLRPLRLRFVEP